jgi:peptidoglycan/xylan/chitin deacetylase (PgdA/CDA1 family)
MPSTPSRRREIERQRRRRRLRRQRQAAALAVLLVASALVGLGLFLSSRDESSAITAAKPGKTQTTTSTARSTARPASLGSRLKALLRSIKKRSQAEETAALERFAAAGHPLYCGGPTGHYVALTFDDGPGPYTEMALGILRDAHAEATFFLVGRNIHPDWADVRQELRDSSALGIHTWSHVSLVGLEPPEIRRQVTGTGDEIARATSTRTHLVRPPYGNHDATVDRVLRRLGMVDVLWSIDSGDSQGKDWQGIGQEVLENVRPGSIVLLHENRGQTIRALRHLILPGLRKKGLIPVTIPELLVLDPPQRGVPTSRCG